MTRSLICLILYLLIESVSPAQDIRSITGLPDYVPVISDSIYLYADFKNIRKETIRVYLINNSDEDFNIDGYRIPLIQQEFRDDDSSWSRSQSYNYGWCGTGYFYNMEIKPEEYVIIHKSFPLKGIEKKVRYNFYGKDIGYSNSGWGRISPDEVRKAEYDDIAINTYNADFLIKIIKKEVIPFEEERTNDALIRKTLVLLRQKFPDQALIILQEIADDPSNKFYPLAVRNLEILMKSELKK